MQWVRLNCNAEVVAAANAGLHARIGHCFTVRPRCSKYPVSACSLHLTVDRSGVDTRSHVADCDGAHHNDAYIIYTYIYILLVSQTERPNDGTRAAGIYGWLFPPTRTTCTKVSIWLDSLGCRCTVEIPLRTECGPRDWECRPFFVPIGSFAEQTQCPPTISRPTICALG
jgi:hypothetical protein